VPAARAIFPLVPKRRLVGLAFGGMRSVRRGSGSDVAGSRPYRPGDPIERIDWAASARLSLARDEDVFVVREHFAEEAPRVVVFCDRRPGMSVFPPEWPWLSKPQAIRACARIVSDSALAARGFMGYLDFAEGERLWRPARTERELGGRDLDRPFRAPDDSLARGLAFLGEQRRDMPTGTFLFVISDFLASPGREAWMHVLEHRWDVVPVIVQDPVWERSFPDVSGIVVPFADPRTGKLVPLGLTAREAAERREANERRYAELVAGFRALDLEPVLVGSSDPREIATAFLAWAERRAFARGGKL
jgi:uncharacterized protein (DUF58 family)